LGEATKVSQYLLDGDKCYQVTCKLGVTTDSGDSDGNVVAEMPIPEITEQTLYAVLPSFVGQQQQVPPMYSALKFQGQPLYKLARQGIEIERKARTVNIYDIILISFTSDSFTLEVKCSKGTYIRTLVEDISASLSTGGHVVALRRLESAGYAIEQAITIESIEECADEGINALDKLLLPTEEALPNWPRIEADDEQVLALRCGQQIQVEQKYEGVQIRLFDRLGIFLGLGEMSQKGIISPKRVFVVDESS
tara:strand:- start:65 stop:817 length:753 start_codon:yes stop_codon:yes gene_type:complete